MPGNLLCLGDNANFLRDTAFFPGEFVGLIYLDPPFNSQRPEDDLDCGSICEYNAIRPVPPRRCCAIWKR